MAGKIIHLKRRSGQFIESNSRCSVSLLRSRQEYQAVVKEAIDFVDIKLSFSMGSDHLPNKLREAFETLCEE
jgi:hypothetical protein